MIALVVPDPPLVVPEPEPARVVPDPEPELVVADPEPELVVADPEPAPELDVVALDPFEALLDATVVLESVAS